MLSVHRVSAQISDVEELALHRARRCRHRSPQFFMESEIETRATATQS